MLKKHILTLTSVLALTVAGTAAAQSVVETTTIENKPPVSENTQMVDLKSYDLNGDGLLTKDEVGEMLFRAFDLDGNHMIDNIEFNKKTFMTFAPMEKTTVLSIDYNDDGVADVEKVTHDTILQETGLSRFDDDGTGLSPRKFIDKGFEELDTNQDKMISLEEWKRAYSDSRSPKSAIQDRYN